jgi:carboxymethylenebutenolidase
MASRWDNVNVDGSLMRCYVSAPEGGEYLPGIVVIQHAGGVDTFIQGMTDRFAAEGFVAIAPDLYHREDPNTSDDALTRMGRLRDNNIVRDVNATVEYLKDLPEVQAERLGITGFCMGGRVAYMMSAHNHEMKAAVVFYGGNIFVPWGEGLAPFDLTDRIEASIMGLFGEDDPNPSPADVAKLDQRLTELRIEHEFHAYPGAGHAFMNENRPSYREEAARDAWQKCIRWFNQHLKQ